MFQLADENSVSQVEVRRGGIEARLHPQRLARLPRLLQLLAQLRLADDLRRALLQIRELLVHRSEIRHGSDYRCRRARPRARGFRGARNYLPLDPNPAALRLDSARSATTSTFSVSTGCGIMFAILSPAWMVY